MGKFEVGNKFSKGRPVGAVNRSTEMMKLTIARAVNNTLDTIQKDLEEIKKRDPEGNRPCTEINGIYFT